MSDPPGAPEGSPDSAPHEPPSSADEPIYQVADRGSPAVRPAPPRPAPRPAFRRFRRISDSPQMSLVGLFGVMAAMGACFALSRLLPLPVFAGLAGFGTLIARLILDLLGVRSLAIHLTWWGWFAMYLLTSVVAVVRGMR